MSKMSNTLIRGNNLNPIVLNRAFVCPTRRKTVFKNIAMSGALIYCWSRR